jgi:hypothetical protein
MIAFVSKLRFIALAGLLLAGCAVEEDLDATDPEPAVVAPVSEAPAEAPQRRFCRQHQDCFGNTGHANFCCNHRCVFPTPGIRCDRDPGLSE